MRSLSFGDARSMTTRAVDRLLQILLGLALVPVLAGAAFGLYFIGEDAGQSGEFLDGLGLMIGLGVLVLVGVPGVLAAVALTRSLRHRPHATSLALAAGVLGTLSTLVFAFVYLPCVAALVPALLVIGVSVAARHDVSA